MRGPLFVKSGPASAAAGRGALREPLTLALLRLGRYQPQQGLRQTLADLLRLVPKLRRAQEAIEEAWAWAQQEQAGGGLADFAADELVAIRLCSSREHDFLLPLNSALCSHRPGAVASEELGLWEGFAGFLAAGLVRLGRRQEAAARLFHLAWVPQKAWDEHFAGREGASVCFAGALSASAREEWHLLATPAAGCVACVLEFDEAMVQGAADIRQVSVAGDAEDEWLLPPYMRGVIESIQEERSPDPCGACVFRVRIRGSRAVRPLSSVLDASPEAALAGALLVGLHNSRPESDSLLLNTVVSFFQVLALAAEVKSLESVQVVWKGYLECLLEGCHSWKELHQTVNSGVVTAARVAVMDVAVAATGVTKRALRFESCINRRAMDEEQARLAMTTEHLKREAVGVAREQVTALQLETLTDPEAFLRFIQHDPVKAFEAAPAAARAFVAAGAAQRVLLFAKLTGLVAMAGGLLRGDPKVQAAFETPLPLREEDPWQSLLATGAALPGGAPATKEQAARRAVGLLQLQRLVVARVRLLVVGGAPDVGKTTFLREVFGLKHLEAGLSCQGRTDQVTFDLHPDGDEQLRPVYLVDTPGFGDGELKHRNDMGRLLLGAGSWIPGGVTLLWVIRAGRSVRQEADELIRQMTASSVAVVVVVTHMDKLFEERYREVGPQWREGPLKDVPTKDERWEQRRRLLMGELREEVAAGVRSVVGREQEPEMVYACLGGWVANTQAEEEDEFAAVPPWPWARRELTAFFNILGGRDLRTWLDSKLDL